MIQQDITKGLIEYIQFNDNNTVSPSILWEGAKSVLRGNIIAISSRLKKERLAEDLENKLNELLTYKAEGQLRFTNQKYYEFGNRASQLLAFQLRKSQSSRVVHKIKCPNTGKILLQPKDVAKAFATYYQELYKEESCQNKKEKMENLLSSINLTKLTEEEADLITSPITREEIKNSILKLKNNKSSGEDGLPGEYYKMFEKELLPLLEKVYNYALSEGDPPQSWSEAIISVIHKDGRRPDSVHILSSH